MTAAVLGYNVTIGIYNGSSYDDLAEVVNITWPGYKRPSIDATTMDSPDKFMEFIPGLIDAGELTFEMNWAPSATDAVLLAMLQDDPQQFKVTYNGGVNIVFQGFVTSWQPQSPLGEKLSASATFKVTGKPTWAAS